MRPEFPIPELPTPELPLPSFMEWEETNSYPLPLQNAEPPRTNYNEFKAQCSQNIRKDQYNASRYLFPDNDVNYGHGFNYELDSDRDSDCDSILSGSEDDYDD